MDRIDIVYVFGAGSVQGAWDPVLRAVEKMVHHPVGHEVANWWFGLQGSFTHLIASWGRLKDEELEARFGKDDHARRRILHFDVTEQPIADWVVQQLRETFPQEGNLRHLVFDRDASFGGRVVSMVESLGLQPTRTAYRSPWQNGVAERWIGSVRRELLDQVVVFNERHLRRLLNEYVAYYHDDRTHDALAKETPAGRRPAVPQVPCSTAVSRPRLGGLHHRYEAAV